MRIIAALSVTALCVSTFAQGIVAPAPATGTLGEASISLAGGVGAQYGPLTLYSNITNFLGFYYPGAFAADDLHMVSGGLVNGFVFGYYDPDGGTALSTLDVLFYQNDAGDSSINGPIAAYTIGQLPGDGMWQITVDLVGGFEFAAPSDMWMAIDFTNSDSPEAGWLITSPPTIGSSHDLFLDVPTLGLYWFGGDPVADFHAEIMAAPEPGTCAALGLGLVGLLFFRRRR
jgi:hypothetical protein